MTLFLWPMHVSDGILTFLSIDVDVLVERIDGTYVCGTCGMPVEFGVKKKEVQYNINTSNSIWLFLHQIHENNAYCDQKFCIKIKVMRKFTTKLLI